MARGDGVHVSLLSPGVHVGMHADAPVHFLADGDRVAALDLAGAVTPRDSCCLPAF
jgi:kynurenine formamidase